MTYDPNIPQPTDIISSSQVDILTNFQQLDTLYNKDHYKYDWTGPYVAPYDVAVAADVGKHKEVTLIRESGDPAIATGANEVRVFCKTASGAPQLFFQPAAAGATYQMTGPINTAANGSVVIAGGLIIKWGSQLTPANSTVINFAGGAFPTAVYSVTTSFSDAGLANLQLPYVLGAPVVGSFTVRNPTAVAFTCRYIAIGI